MNDDERRTCLHCGAPTRRGRWRCDECQANVDRRRAPRLRLVTLPGDDADQIAASRGRHPSQPTTEDP